MRKRAVWAPKLAAAQTPACLIASPFFYFRFRPPNSEARTVFFQRWDGIIVAVSPLFYSPFNRSPKSLPISGHIIQRPCLLRRCYRASGDTVLYCRGSVQSAKKSSLPKPALKIFSPFLPTVQSSPLSWHWHYRTVPNST